MGSWYSRIANYNASQMDYYYENIKKESENLKELINQKVDVKIEQKKGDKWIVIETINVSVLELHTFVLNKKQTKYVMNTEPNNLRNWLLCYLNKKNIEIKTPFCVFGDFNSRDFCTLYLQSEIFDNNIIFSTEYKEHLITNFQQIEWCNKKGFRYPL